MVESDTIELGKMWLGLFGTGEDPMLQPALYERETEPKPKKVGDPVARRAPMLLGAGRNDDLLIGCEQMVPIYAAEGKDRMQVNIAVIRKADGNEQVVVFDRPAYLVNNAGKTVERY